VGLLIAVIFAGAIIARTNSPAPVPHFENTLIAVVNGRPTGCPLSCGKMYNRRRCRWNQDRVDGRPASAPLRMARSARCPPSRRSRRPKSEVRTSVRQARLSDFGQRGADERRYEPPPPRPGRHPGTYPTRAFQRQLKPGIWYDPQSAARYLGAPRTARQRCLCRGL
jgi:hypothetical protein